MTQTKYGRYETMHRIASGGMASVYLGRHLGAGGFERLVAIKAMHEHIAADPSFSTMFLDEARLAAQIRHPNVVPTLDVADDGSYIVMEYVEGASLQAILSARQKRNEEPIPLPRALRIFLDVLSGLHAAHELCDTSGKHLNLVHRDISPHNVLVGVDGMSRITDFGIAFAEARLTSTKSGQLKGKLPYMAPEQLEDGPVTRTTDVYAAGCVLWEMLAGERLFRGSSEAAVACAVLAGPERRVSDVRADIPAGIDAACMRALTRAEDRYPTALAFLEAIEDAADADGVSIARHREVGAVAELEEMTYPAASTLTESDDDPRPPDMLAAYEAATKSDTDVAEPPPTRRVRGGPAVASQTVVSAGEETDAAPLVVAGKTTAHDRPAPEVAKVIREAMGDHPSAVAGRPVSGPMLDFDDTSVVIPKEKAWGSWVVAAVVVALVAIGITLWVRGDDASSATAGAGDGSTAAASAGSDGNTSEPRPVPPGGSAAAAGSAMSAKGSAEASHAGSSASAPPTPPQPPPQGLPSPARPLTVPPPSLPKPFPPEPTPAPKPTSGKYHGQDP